MRFSAIWPLMWRTRMRRLRAAAALALGAGLGALGPAAQAQPNPLMFSPITPLPYERQQNPAQSQGFMEPQKCPRFVADAPSPLRLRPLPAGLQLAQAAQTVNITFLGHASFWIESPAGVTIVTDYSDLTPLPEVPTIATMNIAHSSHHTRNPVEGIAHLLPGWGDESGPADHDLTVRDVWVRNVTTNIRGYGGTQYNRNSIFVFEVARLCIAHLGHLHHKLTREHLEALGRIDIVLAPVDGSYTLDQTAMFEVIREIGAPVVIPMHYFNPATLGRFLARAEAEGFAIDRRETPAISTSYETVPRRRTVVVLPGF